MEELYINNGTELGNESYIGTREEWIAHLKQNTEWYSEYVSHIEDGNRDRADEADMLGESVDNVMFSPVDVPCIDEWAADMFGENCVSWDGVEEGCRL